MMARTLLIALIPLFMLMLQPGCGSESEATTPSADGPGSMASSELPPEELVDPMPALATGSASTNASMRIAAATEEAPIAPAYVVIQNADSRDPQLLVRQLQQVLPKTQVVKQVQSPKPREIKLEVSNIRDVRALANKVPFGSVESVDDRTRTITVDFDL